MRGVALVLRKRSSRVTIGGSTFSVRGGGDGSRSLTAGGGFDKGGGGGRVAGTGRCSWCRRGDGSGCEVGGVGGTTGVLLTAAA